MDDPSSALVAAPTVRANGGPMSACRLPEYFPLRPAVGSISYPGRILRFRWRGPLEGGKTPGRLTAVALAALLLAVFAIALLPGGRFEPPPAYADTITPSGISITSNAGTDQRYDTGDSITVRVTLSGSLTSLTAASLKIQIGSSTPVATIGANANFNSNILDFSYTVTDQDYDADGIAIATDALTFSGSHDHSGTPDSAVATTLPGSLASAQAAHKVNRLVDYDDNDNGLIDIRSLAQLNAVRWDLDGNGRVSGSNQTNYAAAFPRPATRMGCSRQCAGYELRSNLDFDGTAYQTGSGWTPIGGDAEFEATFDGNNHTISNLYINLTTATETGGAYVGLFGLSGGTIREVGLVNPQVTSVRTGGGHAGTGALVGVNAAQGTVGTAWVTGGSVTYRQRATDSNAYAHVGCLVGRSNATGRVTNSHADCAVNGSSDDSTDVTINLGGLVGRNEGEISYSYATGAVAHSGQGDSRAGGMAGYNLGDITASWAGGSVASAAEDAELGGLAGRIELEAGEYVRASYATGSIATSNAQARGNRRVGGLVGYLDASETDSINAAYAIGAVSNAGGASDSINVGGLIGYRYVPEPDPDTEPDDNSDEAELPATVVVNSYWNTETTGQPESFGVGEVGKTTGELKSPTGYIGIYRAWNLNLLSGASVWDFGADTLYPVLQVNLWGIIGYSADAIALQKNRQDATLSDIAGSVGSLYPAVTAEPPEYYLTVPSTTIAPVTLTLSPARSGGTAAITEVSPTGGAGNASFTGKAVTLATSASVDNTVTIRATAPNGVDTRTYTLVISKRTQARIFGPAEEVTEGGNAVFTIAVTGTTTAAVAVNYAASSGSSDGVSQRGGGQFGARRLCGGRGVQSGRGAGIGKHRRAGGLSSSSGRRFGGGDRRRLLGRRGNRTLPERSPDRGREADPRRLAGAHRIHRHLPELESEPGRPGRER